MKRILEAIAAYIEKKACCHKWILVKEITVSSVLDGTWHVFHYHCAKCGEIKRVKSSE